MIFDIDSKLGKFLVTDAGCKDFHFLGWCFTHEGGLRNKWWDIQSGDVVIDVGAGVGSYTLPALAGKAALVIAIEPDRDYFFQLCSSLPLNEGYSPRCHAMNVLVGEEDMVEGDYYPSTHSLRGEGETERRLVLTLDFIVESCKLERLDWIKIDVEGDEVYVLQGALEAIKRFSPKILVENHIAFYPEVRDDIGKLLVPLGYTEENIAGEGKNDNWSLWAIKT